MSRLDEAFDTYQAALAEHSRVVQDMRATNTDLHVEPYLASVQKIRDTRSDLEAEMRRTSYAVNREKCSRCGIPITDYDEAVRLQSGLIDHYECWRIALDEAVRAEGMPR